MLNQRQGTQMQVKRTNNGMVSKALKYVKNIHTPKMIKTLRLNLEINNIKQNNMDIFLKDQDEIQDLANSFRRSWTKKEKFIARDLARDMGFQVLNQEFKRRDILGKLMLDITLPEQSEKLTSDKLIIVNKLLSEKDKNVVIMNLLSTYIFECPKNEKSLYRTRLIASEPQNKQKEKISDFVSNVLAPLPDVEEIVTEQNNTGKKDPEKTVKIVSERFCVPIALAKKRIHAVNKYFETNDNHDSNSNVDLQDEIEEDIED